MFGEPLDSDILNGPEARRREYGGMSDLDRLYMLEDKLFRAHRAIEMAIRFFKEAKVPHSSAAHAVSLNLGEAEGLTFVVYSAGNPRARP